MKKIDMLPYIHESNLIENIDDPKYDDQAMYAWEFLTMQKELNHSVIRRVQKTITLLQPNLRPDQRGYYRDMSGINVTASGRLMPAASLVKGLMDNWLLDYMSHTPKENHIAFERIHPFVDGNGRTGRMLMWWQEIQSGVVPTLIPDSEKAEYYGWF